MSARELSILIIGNGGREHALAVALEADPGVVELHAAPGNPGTAQVATNHWVDPLDGQAVAALAVELGVDLVVIGPEAPLVAGVADAVRTAGVACFGPSASAAQLEGSKSFAKDVMAAAGVPTARAFTCSSPAEAGAALDEFGPPFVVKDDGLAGGKGVVVTHDRAGALAHAAACETVVIEEFLAGPEVSLFSITDRTTVRPLIPAQDFKRALNGDRGPNTGGMGAYAPLPWLPDSMVTTVVEQIVEPTVAELARRGTPFSGLLYTGLAISPTGPKVIEFNARFGDPETQVVLPLLESELGGVLFAAATGQLKEQPPLRWRDGSAVAVVLAAEHYPQTPTTGDVIAGAEATSIATHVIHAGTTTEPDGQLRSAGGRVLSVVGTGGDLATARSRANQRIAAIKLRGSHYRTDIAERGAQLLLGEAES